MSRKKTTVVCDRGCCTVAHYGKKPLGRGGIFLHALMGCCATKAVPMGKLICHRPYGHEGPHRGASAGRARTWAQASGIERYINDEEA
jgi:hypothetical protein